MKAMPFEESRLNKWYPPYIVQPKYDGIRCRAIPTETGYLLLSSEENIIFSVPHINESLNKSGCKEELDGELYCHGMSFEEIFSITSRTANLHQDRELINLHVFDIVDSEPQVKRVLEVSDLENKIPFVSVSPFWVCNDLEDIMRTYDKLIDLGYEGIIVRNINQFYERKRSIWVMKFKPKKEDTYEIVGYKEETDKNGRLKGRMGALVLLSGDGNVFSAGSGLTDESRYLLWNKRDEIIGKYARIKYQHLTRTKVPRFPVFMEVVE